MNTERKGVRLVPPCEINLYEPKEIIQHFRDLINIGSMLDVDYEEEMCRFRRKLKKFGYDNESVTHFVEYACFGNRWEQEIEPPIKNRGNYWEWLKIRSSTR